LVVLRRSQLSAFPSGNESGSLTELWPARGIAVKSIFMRAPIAGVIFAFLMVVAASLTPAYAVDVPPEAEQDVLVRATLMTFNDANMTGNYSVLLAKASKQLQTQFTPDKVAASLESFRVNRLFFEEVVTQKYDSTEKPVIDAEGGLNLAGEFKSSNMEVKYKLRFIQNDNKWKLLGFNVDATRHK
jgi:hypothetical protein